MQETDNAVHQVQQRMIDAFAEATKQPPEQIDVNAPFTRFGLDSMTLFEMTGKLSDWLGIELPAQIFWKYENIAAVSSYIGQQWPEWVQAASPSESPLSEDPLLHCLQKGDADRWTPVFIFHGLTGNSAEYMDLVLNLGEQAPIYALHMSNEETLIETMATRYIQAIKTKQAQGPYMLLGYSSAGNIAYEVARQLREQGEVIAKVLLLDMRPSNRVTSLSDVKKDWLRLLYNQLHFLPQWLGYMVRDAKVRRFYADTLSRLWQKLGSKRNTGLTGSGSPEQERAKRKAMAVSDVIAGMPDEFEQEVRINIEAVWDYYPKPGDMDLLVVKTFQSCVLKPDPALKWAELTSGEVTSLPVSGSHLGMMSSPHVEPLGRALQPRILLER